jgi:hypothetical protein
MIEEKEGNERPTGTVGSEVGTDGSNVNQTDLGAAYKAIINGDDASKEAMLACIKDTDIGIATGDGRREHFLSSCHVNQRKWSWIHCPHWQRSPTS